MIYQNPHYDVNEQTGLITFNTEHRYYRLERDVFTSKGIDIDSIKTLDEYYDYLIAFRYEIRTAFHSYIKNKEAKTIENKFTQSLILGEDSEAKQLEALIDKIEDANIQIIK